MGKGKWKKCKLRFFGYNPDMTATIRQSVTVGPGGLIEIRSNRLKPGNPAEVVVYQNDTSAEISQRSLTSFIGAGASQFANTAEVDSYIRELRDEWQE